MAKSDYDVFSNNAEKLISECKEMRYRDVEVYLKTAHIQALLAQAAALVDVADSIKQIRRT